MKKSDSIKELASALAMAQASMGFAKKDAANPYFKSKYADLAAVVEAIKKPLTEHGLSYSQGTDIDEQGGVIVETLLMHKSGEWIEGRLRMMPVKADPQGIGSCITYARRYGLQAIVGVPADDDDGNAASGNETNANGTKKHQGESAKSVPASTLEQLESKAPGTKGFLSKEAEKIKDAYKLSPTAGLAAYKKAISELDTDEQVAIYAFFDSKQRGFIEKQLDKERAEAAELAKEQELATQP